MAAWVTYCRKSFVSYEGRKGSSHIVGAYFTDKNASHELREVGCWPIDAVAKGQQIGFIKMDIEGSEKQALLGAIETIARNKPKMAIAAYHHEDDLRDIPRLLNTITPYECFIKESPFGHHEKILLCKPL